MSRRSGRFRLSEKTDVPAANHEILDAAKTKKNVNATRTKHKVKQIVIGRATRNVGLGLWSSARSPIAPPSGNARRPKGDIEDATTDTTRQAHARSSKSREDSRWAASGACVSTGVPRFSTERRVLFRDPFGVLRVTSISVHIRFERLELIRANKTTTITVFAKQIHVAMTTDRCLTRHRETRPKTTPSGPVIKMMNGLTTPIIEQTAQTIAPPPKARPHSSAPLLGADLFAGHVHDASPRA